MSRRCNERTAILCSLDSASRSQQASLADSAATCTKTVDYREKATRMHLLLDCQDTNACRARNSILMADQTRSATVQSVSYTHLTLPTNREV